ncbi:CUE domain-containing protein 2-A [Culicoides brevitarsis]|uniref:CUE domain-containing protein 2-A n=1 Tax=Culicoides brevitarsis TaxID=469753 RepID=UPI00307B711B
MTNIERQHETIKNSFFQFINTHIPGADLRIVDEIVLSYVISILEEAAQDDCFEVEDFVEMMSAYFPKFNSISSNTVSSWIIQLNEQLAKCNTNTSGDSAAANLSLNSLSLVDMIPAKNLHGRRISESESQSAAAGAKRVQHISETSDGGSTDSSNCDLFSEECDILQEMFPESSYLEVKHCVTISNGDINKATQILLHRQETGESLHATKIQPQIKKQPVLGDTELKNQIINRYSYVDKVDNREYKPVVPKNEPKKLVRYRDNKVVSLKGERYTEVSKRGDGEDTELKKPKRQPVP